MRMRSLQSNDICLNLNLVTFTPMTWRSSHVFLSILSKAKWVKDEYLPARWHSAQRVERRDRNHVKHTQRTPKYKGQNGNLGNYSFCLVFMAFYLSHVTLLLPLFNTVICLSYDFKLFWGARPGYYFVCFFFIWEFWGGSFRITAKLRGKDRDPIYPAASTQAQLALLPPPPEHYIGYHWTHVKTL